MKRICLLALALAFCSSTIAMGQAKERGLIDNLAIARTTPTTFKLTAIDGRNLSQNNAAKVMIGTQVRTISSSNTFTVPACTVWGSSGTHDIFVYVGWSDTKKNVVCVSDQPGLYVKGAVATGNTGFLSCSATLATTDSVRMVGQISMNCTGPVLDTGGFKYYTTAYQTNVLPVKFFGAASSTTTGTAALVFTVQGLTSTEKCIVTPTALGTGPAYVKSVSTATANTLTVTMDTTQSGGTTTVNYACY